MPLSPVARTSVADAAYHQLRDEILAGAISPGDPLPSERELTEVLGVNRQAVREALKRLDQAGLVSITHGGATRANDYRQDAGLDVLPHLLVRGDVVDIAAARSVLEMRACLGPDIARLAADRALPATAERIGAIVEAMAAVVTDGGAADEGAAVGGSADDGLGELARLDWELWDRLVDASDNVAYRLSYNSLRRAVAPLDDVLLPLRADELRAMAPRRRLAAAVARGDARGAETAARRILTLGTAGVIAALADLTGDASRGAR